MKPRITYISNFSMKRILLKFPIFLIVASIFYVIGLNLFYELLTPLYRPNILRVNTDGLKYKIQESKTISNLDVLFVGSSHTYRSFNPAIFEKYNLKSYNWGTNGQTHLQTQFVLKQFIPLFKPKVVIYEVFPEIFSTNGNESMVEFIMVGAPFEIDLEQMIKLDNSMVLINSYILNRSQNITFGNSKSDFNPEKLYYLGYWGNNKKQKYKQEDAINLVWTPLKGQLQAFEENLRYLKEQKIDVIFVITPFLGNYDNAVEYQNYLAKFGDVYDFNKIPDLFEINDLYDRHHLNHRGATKLSNYLAPIVQKRITN